ncbi:MAG: NapC/NirT family cytochrome c [Chloroflexi bacterium]|nr:NapC/NirT family cytochrome c [Chloroflexota bacterium]
MKIPFPGFFAGIWREYFRLDFKDSRQRRRLLFFLVAGVIEIVLLAIGGYRLAQFMDTPEFCGELCHSVMKPEYVAYQNSPHARVECVDCHIGEGASWLVKSKISGLRQVAAVTLNTYQRPIPSPVEELRPARETCEECHWPQRFAGDLVRVRRHFLQDAANTEQVNTLVLRVGGGEFPIARDIHWHIGAKVWYLPLDEKRQEIAWVGVEAQDGQLVEYLDPQKATDVSPERIKADKRLMDCVDCHNRATHIFYSPDALIDKALALGQIDPALPFIKREGMKALNPISSSLEEANSKIDSIHEFYATSYPQIYEEKGVAIVRAIEQLKGIAKLTTFPEMKVDWETHPNNIGHLQSPGCFRCHGKLETATEGGKDQVIRADCTLCHYPLPSAVAPPEGQTPTPTPAPGTTPEATPTPGPGGPPAIPAAHPTSGCPTCHSSGLAGAPQWPESHVAFTEQICTGCHSRTQP